MGRQRAFIDLGIKLENVTINMLGRAKKVTVEKENTTIVGGRARFAFRLLAARDIECMVDAIESAVATPQY